MSGRVPNSQERDPIKLNQAIRDLFAGRSNAVGTCTLSPGATSTAVQAQNCAPDCKVILFPATASAAAVLSGVYVPKATIVSGGFTVQHGASPATDMEFYFVCLG